MGSHLFPYRTEKLSPLAPMVLHTTRESRSPPSFNPDFIQSQDFFLPSEVPNHRDEGGFCKPKHKCWSVLDYTKVKPNSADSDLELVGFCLCKNDKVLYRECIQSGSHDATVGIKSSHRLPSRSFRRGTLILIL
jgi:hypothetical protein